MADLVFDIGMHNGDDTAYYLASGFEVVAVEANPVLCQAASERFASEIADKQLNGASPIHVSTVPFAELLGEYRVPLYVKVDIEMNDSLCVRDLARCAERPPYFSFEGHVNASADIDVLVGLGYTRFKCVRQIDWREITPENMRRQASIRKLIAHTRRTPRLEARLRRLHYRAPSVNGWRFTPGSSGPLARELPGRWLSRDEVSAVWEHRLAVDREMRAGGLGEWFDIHAAVTSVS